jgi:hypothetical protein
MRRVRPCILFVVAAFLVGCAEAREAQAPAPSADAPAERTELFLAGDQELAVVDVDAETARTVTLEELGSGDPPYRIVRRGRSLVFYGGPTYAVDLALSSPPRRLGSSWFFIPSATEDRIWLAYLDPDSPDTVRALSSVSEVTSAGVVTVPPTRPPQGRWPVAAVSAGLLFEDRSGGLDLWDPATGRMVRRLPDASSGPTYGNLLAWCDAEGMLHLSDVTDTRRAVAAAPPEGLAAYDCAAGTFSPDGETLAVPAARQNLITGARELALVDVASGKATVVEGSDVPGGYIFTAWGSSGDEVFITGGQRREARTIVAYRLGDARARRLAVEVPAFYGVAAS